MPSSQRWQSWLLSPPRPNPCSRLYPGPLGLGSCQAQFTFNSSFQDRFTHGERERETARLEAKKEGTCSFLLPEKPQQHSSSLATAGPGSSVVLEPDSLSPLRWQHLLHGAPPPSLYILIDPTSSLCSPALGAITVSGSHCICDTAVPTPGALSSS